MRRPWLSAPVRVLGGNQSACRRQQAWGRGFQAGLPFLALRSQVPADRFAHLLPFLPSPCGLPLQAAGLTGAILPDLQGKGTSCLFRASFLFLRNLLLLLLLVGKSLNSSWSPATSLLSHGIWQEAGGELAEKTTPKSTSDHSASCLPPWGRPASRHRALTCNVPPPLSLPGEVVTLTCVP